MKLFLDIETAPQVSANQALIDNLRENMKPDGRASDKEGSKLKKFMDLMESAPLEPLLNQIIAVSLAFNDEDPVCLLHEEGDEKDLLQTFARDIAKAEERFEDYLISLVTFNGFSFDVPNIRLKLAKHGIVIPGISWNSPKYDFSNHFDVRLAVTNFDPYGRGTLEQWCLYYGISIGDQKYKGSDIPVLWEQKQFDLIRQKGLNDIAMLRSLFIQVEPYF